MRAIAILASLFTACGGGAALTIADEPAPRTPAVGATICLSGVVRERAVDDAAHLAAEVAHFRALGVKQVRYDVLWTRSERTAGIYDLDAYGATLETLSAAGIGSILLIGYGHPLYNARADLDEFYPPTETAPFAAFAGAVAARLGPRAAAIEIWNEPNAGYRFWKPVEDAHAFAALTSAAAEAIARACPSCTSLFGGVFWHNQFIAGGVDFIRDAFAAAPTLRTQLGGLAVHPYSYYPPTAPPDSAEAPEVPLEQKLSHAQDAAATVSRLPAWLTEVGWPVHATVTERQQATYLSQTYALAAKAGARATCWYDLQDGPHPESWPPEQAFGLLRYHADGPAAAEPKAAYRALVALSRFLGPLGFSRERTTELKLLAGDRALLFRDSAGKQAVTMVWLGVATGSTLARIELHARTTVTLHDLEGAPLPLTLEGRTALVPITAEPRFLIERVD